MTHKHILLNILIAVLFLVNNVISAQDTEPDFSWPMEIESDNGNYINTLYQPQLESFESNILEGRLLPLNQKTKKGFLANCGSRLVF